MSAGQMLAVVALVLAVLSLTSSTYPYLALAGGRIRGRPPLLRAPRRLLHNQNSLSP